VPSPFDRFRPVSDDDSPSGENPENPDYLNVFSQRNLAPVHDLGKTSKVAFARAIVHLRFIAVASSVIVQLHIIKVPSSGIILLHIVAVAGSVIVPLHIITVPSSAIIL
jgi:hypothetical protein